MRLKKKKISKQAVALAVAAAVTVSAPVGASAVTFDVSGGTVYVESDTSYQVQDDDSKYTGENDGSDTITITNKDNITTSDTIVDVADNVSDVDIVIENVQSNVQDDGNDKTDDSTIEVGDNVSDVTITVTDSTLKSNVGKEGVIDIGENATNVNLTLEDTTIVMGVTDNTNQTVQNTQNAIRVDAGAEDVTITVEGDVTIKAESSTTVDNIENDTAHKIINGIVVGGDGADAVEDGEEAEVTITSENDGDLTIQDTTTGIVVHGNSELIVDGNDGKLDVEITDTHATSDRTSSRSGDAITAYGDLEITDGADVTIDQFGRYGIDANGNIEVSDSTLTIQDTDTAQTPTKHKGGIYHNGSEGEITVSTSTVKIDVARGNGIGDEGADITIEDSKMTVDAANGGFNVTGGGDLTVDNSTLTITDQSNGTGAADGAIYLQGADDNASELTITNGSKVTINQAANGKGIHLIYNADGTIEGDGTEVTVNSCAYGVMLQGDSDVENKLVVQDKAKLDIKDFAYEGGIVIGYGAKQKKALEIKSDAVVTIDSTSNSTYGNGVLLYGDTRLLVDYATLDTKKRISAMGAASTIEILGGAKVVTPDIWNVNGGLTDDLNLWITGGTLTLTGTQSLDGVDADSVIDTDDMYKIADSASTGLLQFWATNGDYEESGYTEENVTCFALTADNLNALIARTKANKKDETEAGYIEITTGKYGNQELRFVAYGIDADGNYVPYTYVVDLDKAGFTVAADGTLTESSSSSANHYVWVPAGLLEWYYPDESKEVLDTRDEANAKANVAQVKEANEAETYNDAVARGQSMNFSQKKYYTTNIFDNHDETTWYYYDYEKNEWVEFSKDTPVLKMLEDAEVENSKPIVGVVTPEEPEPEEPEEPTNPTPTIPEYEPNGEENLYPANPVTPSTPAVQDATPEAETPVNPAVQDATPTTVPETETPTNPAVQDAKPTSKLPQTGADWISSITLAASGLAISLGSIFDKKKARHAKR